jgi:hypothetical protein
MMPLRERPRSAYQCHADSVVMFVRTFVPRAEEATRASKYRSETRDDVQQKGAHPSVDDRGVNGILKKI